MNPFPPKNQNNQWPVRFAAISASHELFESPQAALDDTVRLRVERRTELRRQCEQTPSWSPYAVENTRLNRSIDGGIDDLKFLYPVLDNIPMIVFPLLHFARAGVKMCVYGSPEICRVVEVIRVYLKKIGWLNEIDDLITVTEKKNDISFFKSFEKSTNPFSARSNDSILWSAADLVLAYDVWPWLLDRDIEHHQLIVNMIARRLIFPNDSEEFLRLNYFDNLRRSGDVQALEVKQPDVLVFTGAGRQGLVNLNGVRGQPEAALFHVFLQATWRGIFGKKMGSVARGLQYGLRRKQHTLSANKGLLETDASNFASVFFGVQTKVKTEIADPFVLKDGDGFEDVFGYYRAVLQSVVDSNNSKLEGYRKLANFYPYAGQLFDISEQLQPLWNELPLWKHWPEFINDKIATYNQRLTREFKAAGVDDGHHPLPNYFEKDGRFLAQPSLPHADIKGTLQYLQYTYLPGFERGYQRYRELTNSDMVQLLL